MLGPSRDSERLIFRDRRQAGRVLARQLEHWRGQAVVLGVPRGGVVVADEVARALDAELDVAVAKKLGAPGQPELAIGAVAADGTAFVNEELVVMLRVPQWYLDAERYAQQVAAAQRETELRGLRPAVPLEGRTVIVVDDGLATGATVKAAVRAARKQHPARIIVAAPVGSSEACADLRLEADQVVCALETRALGAIGFYYLNFQPVSDDEVRRVLTKRAAPVPAGHGAS